MSEHDQTINIVRPHTNSTSLKQPEKQKYPSESIGLPSEGHFYDLNSPLTSGLVDIKYMTAKEEDILTSQNLIKKGVVLEKLLASLIVTPGVNIDDLLIGDKNALFIASRRLAYGDSYGPLEVTCPKCSTEGKCTVDLSSVKNKPFDFSLYEKGTNSFSFTLPASKKVLRYKLLTHKDEQLIDQEITSLGKVNKTGNTSEITTRFKRMILSVDGNEEKSVINKFVDTEFLSKDSLAFRNKVKENTPDIDMSFDYVCENCNHGERMGIPLSVSFFWPNS